MAEINEKDFLAELIFCIEQSDVIKAKALVQFFAEIQPKAQNRALYELSKSPDEIAFPVLDYMCDIKSRDDQINQKVYDLLLEIGYGNPVLLREYLQKRDLNNRPAYIRIAGELRQREAVPLLVDILKKETAPEIVGETIRALGLIGAPEAVSGLVDFLYSDDDVLKHAGIEAIAEIGSEEAIQELAKAVSGNDRTDKSIILGLAGIQNQRSLSELGGLLSSGHAGIRSMAIESLIQIGPKAVPILVEQLASQNVDLQVHTLTILGKIGDKTAVPAVQKLLYERPEDPNVRFGAYEALGRLPSAKTAISLASGLHDPDEQVRMAAAKAIDKNLSPVLLAGLKNMIKAGDEDARQVVGTLLESESDAVFEALMAWETFPKIAMEHLLRHAPPEIQQHFASKLKASGHPQLAKKLEESTENRPQADKPMVYAIDDSVMMLKLYRKKLHAMGYHPMIFQYPAEALKAIRKSRPDVIITDLNMPAVNGLQLTAAVREVYGSQELPIVMITTQSDFLGRTEGKTSRPVTEESIKSAGVNVVLHKPFRDDELESVLASFLKRS